MQKVTIEEQEMAGGEARDATLVSSAGFGAGGGSGSDRSRGGAEQQGRRQDYQFRTHMDTYMYTHPVGPYGFLRGLIQPS